MGKFQIGKMMKVRGKNSQPPIKVNRTKEGTIFEIITVVVLIVLWVLTVLLYRHAPEQVPVHYGYHMNPDTMGSRSSLIVMAVFGTFCSVMMLISAYYPDKAVNLPYTITQPEQYVYIVRMVRLLAVEVALLFLGIVIMMGTSGLGYFPMAFFFLMLFLVIVTTIVYSVKAYQQR